MTTRTAVTQGNTASRRVHTPLTLSGTLLLLLIVANPAWARVGETEAQIRQRYGEPSRESEGDIGQGLSDKEMYFQKGDITVVVSIKNGRSAAEGYAFSKLGQKQTIEGELLTQAIAIIDANSQGHGWEKHPAPGLQNPDMKHFWMRGDGQAAAIIWNRSPDRLEIMSMSLQADKQRSIEAEKAGVGGF